MASNDYFNDQYNAEVEFSVGESPTSIKFNNWAQMMQTALKLQSRALGDQTFYQQIGTPGLTTSLSRSLGLQDLISPPFQLKADSETGKFSAYYTVTLTEDQDGIRDIALPYPPEVPGTGETWENIFIDSQQHTAFDPAKYVAPDSFTGTNGEWTLIEHQDGTKTTQRLILYRGFNTTGTKSFTYKIRPVHPLLKAAAYCNLLPSLEQLGDFTDTNWYLTLEDNNAYFEGEYEVDISPAPEDPNGEPSTTEVDYRVTVEETTILGSLSGYKLTLPYHIITSKGDTLQSGMLSQLEIPDWYEDVVEDSIYPDGLFLLWDNIAQELVWDADGNPPTFHRDETNPSYVVLVSGPGLSLTVQAGTGGNPQYALVCTGHTVAQAIQDVADYLDNQDHAETGKIIPHDYIGNTVPSVENGQEIKYALSNLPAGHHPVYSHRDGYVSGSDTANHDNAYLGDFLLAAKTKSSGSTVDKPDYAHLDVASRKVMFGKGITDGSFNPSGNTTMGVGWRGETLDSEYRLNAFGHLDGSNSENADKSGIFNFAGANFLPDVIVTQRGHQLATGTVEYRGDLRTFDNLSDAITYCSTYTGAKRILIEEGTYTISSSLVIPSGIIIKGQGTNTILQTSDSGTQNSILDIGVGASASFVALSDLKLKARINISSSTKGLLRIGDGTSYSGLDSLIDNVYFDASGSLSVTGINIASGNIGIPSKNNLIRNCYFDADVTTAIYNRARVTRITDCKFNGNDLDLGGSRVYMRGCYNDSTSGTLTLTGNYSCIESSTFYNYALNADYLRLTDLEATNSFVNSGDYCQGSNIYVDGNMTIYGIKTNLNNIILTGNFGIGSGIAGTSNQNIISNIECVDFNEYGIGSNKISNVRSSGNLTLSGAESDWKDINCLTITSTDDDNSFDTVLANSITLGTTLAHVEKNILKNIKAVLALYGENCQIENWIQTSSTPTIEGDHNTFINCETLDFTLHHPYGTSKTSDHTSFNSCRFLDLNLNSDYNRIENCYINGDLYIHYITVEEEDPTEETSSNNIIVGNRITGTIDSDRISGGLVGLATNNIVVGNNVTGIIDLDENNNEIGFNYSA